MIRGLYTSALGMMSSMQRMDVITNNMANVNTTGYKRDHVISQSFSDLIITRLNDPGVMRIVENLNPIVGTVNPGVFVDDIFTVFQQGPMQHTGNTLDLALKGEGFFVVMRGGYVNGENGVNGNGNGNGNGGERLFTRDGAFELHEGMLMTITGERVQGLNGNIRLPNGYITINENAQIFVNGEYIDTLLLTNFSDLHGLRRMEDNLFTISAHSEEIPVEGVRIHQGFLEGSNVNIVQEMVQMITTSRAYETNARMLTAQDGTLQQAVNNIARRQ
jgi:flagellar basal-body rod protein FlgG